MARRKMDSEGFSRAMKKRGIDSSEIVRKSNLNKRKGISLTKIREKYDNKLDIESSDDGEMDIESVEGKQTRSRKMIKRTKSQLRD
jgi:hypothetical protein